MIVKIGDKKYDSEKEPIMIELSLGERELIASMDQSATKYCSYPDGMTDVDIAKFMELEIGDEVEPSAEEPGDGISKDKEDDGDSR